MSKRCKHLNVRFIETIAAEHVRTLIDGEVDMNNEYGNGISREIVCLDCDKIVRFNWHKNYPKWIDNRLEQMGYQNI